MRFVSGIIQALICGIFTMSPLTMAAEPDAWHELLRIMQFADVNRAALEHDCRDNPQFTSNISLKKMCDVPELIPDDVIVEAAIPYIKKYFTEDLARSAIAQLSSKAAREINDKLIVEISTGKKDQLTKFDLDYLQKINESEIGWSLSAFSSDKEQGLAVAKAMLEYVSHKRN